MRTAPQPAREIVVVIVVVAGAKEVPRPALKGLLERRDEGVGVLSLLVGGMVSRYGDGGGARGDWGWG